MAGMHYILDVNVLLIISLQFFTIGKISAHAPPIFNFRVRIMIRFNIRVRFKVRIRVKDSITSNYIQISKQ